MGRGDFLSAEPRRLCWHDQHPYYFDDWMVGGTAGFSGGQSWEVAMRFKCALLATAIVLSLSIDGNMRLAMSQAMLRRGDRREIYGHAGRSR